MVKRKSYITAVIINYFSAKLALKAVDSIIRSSSLDKIEIVVVDNSCDVGEEKTLKSRLPADVHLVVNTKNVGFGKACNQIFDQTDSDFFLLLNPDALLIDDALIKLHQTLLDNPQVGAVSPQAFWDEDLKFFIPPAHSPLLFFIQPELLQAGVRSYIYAFSARLWRRYSLKVWFAKSMVRVMNICGGHVLLRREAVLKSGGLFDPRFFLYFEDTDLFMRMDKAGYKMVIQPKAKAVHHYNQCDKINIERKDLLMKESYEAFVSKHLDLKYRVLKKFVSIIGRLKSEAKVEHEVVIEELERISLPGDSYNKWLFEWSPNKDFIPSVGYFGQGSNFLFPQECAGKLAPGKYYLRFGKPTFSGPTGPVHIWIKK